MRFQLSYVVFIFEYLSFPNIFKRSFRSLEIWKYFIQFLELQKNQSSNQIKCGKMHLPNTNATDDYERTIN